MMAQLDLEMKDNNQNVCVYKPWLSFQSKFFQVVLQSFSSIAWKEKTA